jgi:hypothetical protein
MSRELRREPRVNADLEVELETAGEVQTYTTRNASFKGAFVLTNDPLPLRRLVRFRLDIGEDDEDIVELIGVVAHTLNAADAHESGREPGMGITLYPLSPDHGERWRSFVRTEYERDPEAHARLVASELPRLRLHLKNDQMKERFFGTDFPSGEIFYRTPELIPEGSPVVCEVTHPDTGKTLELFATVTEVVSGARRDRGLRIVFEDMSEASTEKMHRFERGELSEAVDEG